MDSVREDTTTPVPAAAGIGVITPPFDPQCAWVATHQSGWQEGEQGVIEAVAAHLEPHLPEEARWCVEFGAGDGDGLPLTVRPLIDCEGWKSLLIEPARLSYRRLCGRVPKSAVVVQTAVTIDGEQSIDSLMALHGCPPNPAVMVVDVDSIEYHIVEAMKSRPAILCVETLDRNSPRQTDTVYIPSASECGTLIEDGFDTVLQANGAAFDVLLGNRGYVLVYRTRYNSIYVRGDMIPKLRKNKVNLGCGEHNFPGYEPVDIRVNGKDVRTLDYPDNSQDEVYASHVLEHLPATEVPAALAEWVRVLKPGGTLRIAVPDVQKVGAELAKGGQDDAQLMYLMAVLYGSQNYDTNFHKWGYTEQMLRRAMNLAGLGSVRVWKPFIDDCSKNPYSLNLEGTKRWWPKVESPKVVLVLSQPRLAFSGHEQSLLKLAQKIRFETVFSHGAFWDRDMTISTQQAMLSNPDFIFYSDYDSMFDEQDVLTLLDTINNDPTMAAIGAMQMSRHNDAPLVMDQTVDYTGDTSRVRFQHFGAMFIRPQVFEEMEQPWFWSVPGKTEDGKWDWQGWGRSDADITFWRNCDMLGFKVYQHNKVQIGHIVQSVKYPRPSGKGVLLTPIENVMRHGKPSAAGFKPEVYKKDKEAEKKAEEKGS